MKNKHESIEKKAEEEDNDFYSNHTESMSSSSCSARNILFDKNTKNESNYTSSDFQTPRDDDESSGFLASQN